MSNATSTMASKAATCPKCGDTFQDLRGLNGHLRFKHQMPKEEVNEIVAEKKEHIREREEAEGPTEPQNPIILAADRLARAKARTEAVKEASGEGFSEGSNPLGGGYHKPYANMWQRVKGEAVKVCEKEEEEARKALNKAMQREVDRREEAEAENDDGSSKKGGIFGTGLTVNP